MTGSEASIPNTDRDDLRSPHVSASSGPISPLVSERLS